MSAHLERESGPRRFVVHAVPLHPDHVYELDVPSTGCANRKARDARRVAPRAHLVNGMAIAFATRDHQLVRDGFAVDERPHRECVPDAQPIRIRERHDLRGIAEHRREPVAPRVADLDYRLDVLLILLARVVGELAIARARRPDARVRCPLRPPTPGPSPGRGPGGRRRPPPARVSPRRPLGTPPRPAPAPGRARSPAPPLRPGPPPRCPPPRPSSRLARAMASSPTTRAS